MIRELRLILWFVLGAFLVSVSVSAFAAGGLIGYCSSTSFTTSCKSSVDDAIKSYCGVTTNKRVFGSPPALSCNSSYCLQQTTYLIDTKGYATDPSDDCFATANAYYCPDGKTWNGTACTVPDPCSSRSGQALDDGSIDFGDGANKKLSMSFPARSDDNYVGQTFCSGGCLAAVDREVGSAGMTVDGTYYGQFSAKYSGQSCPTGQAAASPKTSPALIPKNTAEYDCIASGMGYGYVGSTVKCVAKTSSKETETKSTQTTNADGTRTTVNKTDSTVCASGVCTTTTTTTTTQYNSSGTATGTAITSETTTKADPNSGLGTGGTGNGQQQQGAECGIAGKPPCGVKVDETGVESDVTTVDQSAKQKIIAAYDEVKQKMEEVTRPQNWGVTWVYQPPAGACSALQYGVTAHQFSINVCKPLGYIRDLWSYVIYVMTGLYVWRSARDAMNIV